MLIALSLTAVLITFLFSFFVQSAKIEKKLDTARTCISKRGYLQTRLQTILSSLDSSFYTKQEYGKALSLTFQFDNGIDPDPVFSGMLLGEIFLDADNLKFTASPITKEKEPPLRTEILFSNIKNFEFSFLGPHFPSEGSLKQINPNFAWRSQWPKTIGSMPSMIRLTLYEKDFQRPTEYAFLLPVAEHIQYLEKKAL